MIKTITAEYIFDKKDVYTWANATRKLEGQRGYFGHSIDTLETAIKNGWLNTCDKVLNEDSDQVQNVFLVITIGQCYGCFLPEEKLIKR